MFEAIQQAPPDPILGLSEAFKADPNPDKINLGVGVYQNDEGKTPVLEAVKRAEAKVLEAEATKGYLPITGSADYAANVQQLLFGADNAPGAEGRAVTAHTPGGTGSLRVAAEFLHVHSGGSKVWLTTPTWPNHGPVFAAAGVETATFPWFNSETNGFDAAAALDGLGKIPAGDVVLLHGCCHNPTGCDPTAEEWQAIADMVAGNGLLPIVDIAYQGLGDGLDEDAVGMRDLLAKCPELIICSSFSKNFGLYRERTGALTMLTKDADTATKLASQLKVTIRTNYSNPPSHGGAVVAAVFADPELRALWEKELGEMRDRLNRMRSEFAAGMKAAGADRDFGFLTEQRGMFSMLGLSPDQVGELRNKYAIYMAGSSRVNVAGMTGNNLAKLCAAVAEVL